LIDIFLRSSNVGNTSIITHPVTHAFDRAISNAIGVGFFTLRVETSSDTASLQIWDTARQERYRTLAPMSYRSAQVTALVYAVDDSRSLTDHEAWVKEMWSQIDRMPRPYVLGTKMDLLIARKVTPPEGEELAQKFRAVHCEVSAKAGSGSMTSFEQSRRRPGEEEMEWR
jgi:GTPase SAR1 family protein